MANDTEANNQHWFAPHQQLPIIGATDWGGVFMESSPGKMVLCLLPNVDEHALDLVPEAPDVGGVVETLIVHNDPRLEGFLWGTELRRRLGLGETVVFATEPTQPIDRLPTRAKKLRKANKMPRRLRRRSLTIHRENRRVIRATWALGGAALEVLVGAGISFDLLSQPPHPFVVIGTIALPKESSAPPSMELLTTLKEVTLLRGVPPETTDAMLQYWSSLGIATRDVAPGPPVPRFVETSLALLEPLQQGEQAKVVEMLGELNHMEVELAIVSIAAHGQAREAQELAELAISVFEKVGRLQIQRAIAAFLNQERDVAIEAYREALEHEESTGTAASYLSLLMVEEGDFETALELTQTALASDSLDLNFVQTALSVHVAAGDVDRALDLLREHSALFDEDELEALQRTLEAQREGQKSEIPKSSPLHRFPLHAAMMSETGSGFMQEGRWERAIEALRRAVELDPTRLEPAADLGRALSQVGRESDAVEHYDRAIENALGGELLHFNRGNAKHRLGCLDEALADYERCCKLVPEWHDARVNRIATLHGLDRLGEARHQLERLEEFGAPAEVVASLKTQLDPE